MPMLKRVSKKQATKKKTLSIYYQTKMFVRPPKNCSTVQINEKSLVKLHIHAQVYEKTQDITLILLYAGVV